MPTISSPFDEINAYPSMESKGPYKPFEINFELWNFGMKFEIFGLDLFCYCTTSYSMECDELLTSFSWIQWSFISYRHLLPTFIVAKHTFNL